MYQRNYDRVKDWNTGDQIFVAHMQNDCTADCNQNYYAGEVYGNNWSSQRGIIEVNTLITSLKTSRSSGSYKYLGQYNGHSYFMGNYLILKN